MGKEIGFSIRERKEGVATVKRGEKQSEKEILLRGLGQLKPEGIRGSC